MLVQSVEKMKAFSSEKMKKVKMFDSEHMFCDLYCFEPGQSQKTHLHEGEDKVYYVLEGEGMFQIGGEETCVRKGSATMAEAGIMHGVVNKSSEALVVLVFMAPKPAHGKKPERKG
ncbi:MAG: cupin domain-containing protein [Nitrospiria bacterium]